MSRDHNAPADHWHPLAVGLWRREPPPRGVVAVVRQARGAFAMSVRGGAWLPAGETLLAATEHAGGHAARIELAAERGGDDLCGDCATCRRMATEAKG